MQEDRCKPKKCHQECKKSCARRGGEVAAHGALTLPQSSVRCLSVLSPLPRASITVSGTSAVDCVVAGMLLADCFVRVHASHTPLQIQGAGMCPTPRAGVYPPSDLAINKRTWCNQYSRGHASPACRRQYGIPVRTRVLAIGLEGGVRRSVRDCGKAQPGCAG